MRMPSYPHPDMSEPGVIVLAPGIQQKPGVCGGRPTIGNGRIEPWHVVLACRSGGFHAALEAYPHLEPQGIALALAFAIHHPEHAKAPSEGTVAELLVAAFEPDYKVTPLSTSAAECLRRGIRYRRTGFYLHKVRADGKGPYYREKMWPTRSQVTDPAWLMGVKARAEAYFCGVE